MTYITERPEPTEKHLEQIAKLEKEAAAMRQRAEDSFQRCDTDGFLSQWANQIGARKNDAKIALLRTANHSQFPVLCDIDGNVIADRIHSFVHEHPRGWGVQVRESWRLSDTDAARYGRKWVPVGSKSRVQKQIGLHEEDRWFPAYATIESSGTGLSGAASAYVTVKRGTED